MLSSYWKAFLIYCFFSLKNGGKQSAAYFRLGKKSCNFLFFQEENLKEKKNIWRSSASLGSSQANTSARLPMRSPLRTSNKSRSLWTVSTTAAGVPGPRCIFTSWERYRFHYQKLPAFQAGVALARDAHLYTGHFQGQDLAFEFDKSTLLILNITTDTFHKSLGLLFRLWN